MQDCHENVERDFMTVNVGQWTLKTLLYCLRPVYTMMSTLDKIITCIHTYPGRRVSLVGGQLSVPSRCTAVYTWLLSVSPQGVATLPC